MRFSLARILSCGFLHGSSLELTFLKTNLSQAGSETGSYLITDNICISYEYKDFEKIETASNKEISSICYGFTQNKSAICNSHFLLNNLHFFF